MEFQRTSIQEFVMPLLVYERNDQTRKSNDKLFRKSLLLVDLPRESLPRESRVCVSDLSCLTDSAIILIWKRETFPPKCNTVSRKSRNTIKSKSKKAVNNERKGMYAEFETCRSQAI